MFLSFSRMSAGRVLRLFLVVGSLILAAPGAWGASAVATHGALRVEGSQVVDQSGAPVGLSGVSFFWSNDNWGGDRFYRDEVVAYFQQEWNASIVRASMGADDNGGYISSPVSNMNKVRTIIDAAIDQGVYVIVDWHSHHAEDYEAEAVAFFQEIARLYGDTLNVIYEPYNEPLNTATWAGDVKPFAEAVIAAIREIDPDNLIIVGSPSWSQDVHRAAADPITGYDNIAYTFHFYAGTHGKWLRDRVAAAMQSGIAVFCSEWGTVNANGDGAVATAESDAWIAFMKENHISNCNWAANNKAEGASVFTTSTSPTAGTWTDANLTASGLYTKAVVTGWTATDYDGAAELSPFVNWLSAYGLPADLAATADVDGDGLGVRAEHAFNLSPVVQSADEPVLFIPGETGMKVQFTPVRTDLVYTVQQSTNGVDWADAGSSISVNRPFSVTVAATDATFVRVVVSEK